MDAKEQLIREKGLLLRKIAESAQTWPITRRFSLLVRSSKKLKG